MILHLTTLTKSACPFRVHNNIGCAYESLACEQASSTQPAMTESKFAIIGKSALKKNIGD